MTQLFLTHVLSLHVDVCFINIHLHVKYDMYTVFDSNILLFAL